MILSRYLVVERVGEILAYMLVEQGLEIYLKKRRRRLVRAVLVEKPGGADQLKLAEIPIPNLAADELLVKVEATAVNRSDIVMREGLLTNYKKNSRLGLEISGVVEKVGANCKDWKSGDKVMSLVTEGGYAEYAVVPGNIAMPIPENMSFEEAAAVPEVFLTAYQTLFWIGKLQQNETVLIHAGASGVGTAAIQLAKQLSKAKVIVTAGSEEKLAVCRELGADFGINYKKTPFDEEVLKITDGQGVNLILDFIGASYWKKNINSLNVDGRLVLIGILDGIEIEKVNLMALLGKRIQVTGTLLSTRSNEYKAKLSHEVVQKVLPLFKLGKLKPIIDQTFSLEEVQRAHLRMEENKNIGKIILSTSSI